MAMTTWITDQVTYHMRYQTSTLRCPTGKWILVGTVPISLAQNDNGTTRVYETEADAIAAMAPYTKEHTPCAYYSASS